MLEYYAEVNTAGNVNQEVSDYFKQRKIEEFTYYLNGVTVLEGVSFYKWYLDFHYRPLESYFKLYSHYENPQVLIYIDTNGKLYVKYIEVLFCLDSFSTIGYEGVGTNAIMQLLSFFEIPDGTLKTIHSKIINREYLNGDIVVRITK